jgi:hypothetical protein
MMETVWQVYEVFGVAGCNRRRVGTYRNRHQANQVAEDIRRGGAKAEIVEWQEWRT